MERSFSVSVFLSVLLLFSVTASIITLGLAHVNGYGDQPLSQIAIHKAVIALRASASIEAYPIVLGLKATTFNHYFSCLRFNISFKIFILVFFVIGCFCFASLLLGLQVDRLYETH